MAKLQVKLEISYFTFYFRVEGDYSKKETNCFFTALQLAKFRNGKNSCTSASAFFYGNKGPPANIHGSRNNLEKKEQENNT